MPRNDLARLVRARAADLDALRRHLNTDFWIEGPDGRRLFGDSDTPPGSQRHEVRAADDLLGAVRGGPDAAMLAAALRVLHAAEGEKLALAAETLGRYKELSLLYDMSDALSRVLDVEQVAAMVVEQAARFFRARAASLFVLEQNGRVRALATTDAGPNQDGRGGEAGARLGAVGRRVLDTGRAELAAHEQAAQELAAPLRSGERVFGVLWVCEGRKPWTAGDLKLVTAMAANAASALSHALLHRDHLRRQALRVQIERFVSPDLLRAALVQRGAVEGPAHARVAVLYADLGALARSIAPEASADEVVASFRLASSIAVDTLLAVRATVNVLRSEMLVACLAHPEGFTASARAAVRAAQELQRVLDASFGVGLGLGVAAADTSDGAAFVAGVEAAALLESAADGRLLVDAAVAREVPATPLEDGETMAEQGVHEVVT